MSAKLLPIDRFMGKLIALDEEDGECWIWQSPLTVDGYGRFALRNGFMAAAHRWSYEHFNGPIPDGFQIDHLCRQRSCVNPAHLEAVTQRENLRRARFGRAGAAA